MIASNMEVIANNLWNELYIFVASATRALKNLLRQCRRSPWFPLLAVAGGALLGIVAIKLIALLGAAFDISFLRDVGNNVDPSGAAGGAGAGAGGAAGGGGKTPHGLLYVSAQPGITLHQDPSTDSPLVGTDPHGSRVIYDTIQKVGGQDWYRIIGPTSTPGWVPGSDLSSTRPPPLPPGRPLRLIDTGLFDAHPNVPMVGAANG